MPVAALGDAIRLVINGEPIPLAHGGPLRLIVPGYQGVNNIKYIKRLALTPQQLRARSWPAATGSAPRHQIQSRPAFGLGTGQVLDQWPPLSEQGPLKAGMTQIHGAASAGAQPLQGVEVSVDGGATWSRRS